MSNERQRELAREAIADAICRMAEAGYSIEAVREEVAYVIAMAADDGAFGPPEPAKPINQAPGA